MHKCLLFICTSVLLLACGNEPVHTDQQKYSFATEKKSAKGKIISFSDSDNIETQAPEDNAIPLAFQTKEDIERFLNTINDKLHSTHYKQYTCTKPSISLTKAEYGLYKVASYCKDHIFLEEQAFNILLKEFSSDYTQLERAIAFIIAHEYSHHIDCSSIGAVCSCGDSNFNLNHLQEPTHEELADYRGAVNAYIAGYDPRGVVKKALYALFNSREYRFIGKDSTHLSFDKRLELPEDLDFAIRDMISAFELASGLSVAGAYVAAADLYKYLIEYGYYNGKEVYLHLANNLFLNALEEDASQKYAFILPDDNLHFVHEKPVVGLEPEAFDEAKKYYQMALSIDEYYTDAWLGLINTLAASRNDSCQFYFEKLKNKFSANKFPRLEAQNAVAIWYAQQKKDTEAIALWESIIRLDLTLSNSVSFNLARFKDDTYTKSTEVLLPIHSSEFPSFPSKDWSDFTALHTFNSSAELNIRFNKKSGKKVWQTQRGSTKPVTLYKMSKHMLPKGVEETVLRYKHTNRIYDEQGGYYAVFRKQKLTFYINKNGEIEYWYWVVLP